MTQPQQLPTPELFFAQAVILADHGRQSLLNAEKVRQQLSDAVDKFGKSKEELLADIDKKHKELKRTYAPEAMETAANSARATVARFQSDIDSIIENVSARADRLANGLIFRVPVWSVVSAAVITVFVWLALQWIPSLDEIQQRQSEFQTLNQQVAGLLANKDKLNSEVELLRGRLVEVKGQWYARYDPAPVTICLDPNRQNTCAAYVRVR